MIKNCATNGDSQLPFNNDSLFRSSQEKMPKYWFFSKANYDY